ncbi:hypothetical protein L0337_11655 [candidate division KSB1 bacterium]|nr:hypothetical protein [candidate division KSB1 bacterium]
MKKAASSGIIHVESKHYAKYGERPYEYREVQQLNADNPRINRLAKPIIDREKYSFLTQDEAFEEQIKALIAAELAQKIRP